MTEDEEEALLESHITLEAARLEKIHALRKAIQEGTYSIPAVDLAEAIMDGLTTEKGE